MLPLADPGCLPTLQEGEIALEGRFAWGSNYTLLVKVTRPGGELAAVYKPTRGERPLWDFPAATLAHREAAAYLVSEALGWSRVPPTVFRPDGPLGAGSLQMFVEHDPERHFFTFPEEERSGLKDAAVFDLLINNADRKAGHFIQDAAGRIWLIDHGICFHVEPKLRTVLWDFAGEPVPAGLLAAVETFLERLAPAGALETALAAHLAPDEIEALRRRAARLLASGRFPSPPRNSRPYPWLLV